MSVVVITGSAGLVGSEAATYFASIRLIIHAASQPSHDWAAKDPEGARVWPLFRDGDC